MPTKTIELHEEAAADYDAAFDWYLARSPEAARAFDVEFERALGEIVRSPGRWRLALIKPAEFFSGGFLTWSFTAKTRAHCKL